MLHLPYTPTQSHLVFLQCKVSESKETLHITNSKVAKNEQNLHMIFMVDLRTLQTNEFKTKFNVYTRLHHVAPLHGMP